VYVH